MSSSVRFFYPKFNTQSLLQAIEEKLPELNKLLPLKLVTLFGSYAQGNYTVASDIDLLVVYKGAPRPDAFAAIIKTLSIPQLEPHIYTDAEYQQMENTLERMIREGKVIYKE